jgi:hypothetical protein
MNNKQLSKLVVAFLAVAVIGWILVQKRNQSWSQGEASIGGQVMPEFPLNEVEKLSIQDANGEVTLLKTEETWKVEQRGSYAADFAKIRDLLIQVSEVKTLRPMQVGESQLGRLELLEPGSGDKAGTLLTFTGKEDKVLGKLLLGKQSMKKSESSSFGGGEFPDGRYLMADGDINRISQVSEAFSSVNTEASQWLDKTFFKVEKLKSISLTHPESTNSWHVTRESDTADMVLVGLAEGEELDSSRSYSLKNVLSSPSFNDVVGPDTNLDDLGLDAPIAAELETFDGFSYAIKLGKPNADEEHPMQVSVSASIAAERVPEENEKEEDKEKLDQEHAERVAELNKKLESEQALDGVVFWVSKWTVDTLLKNRSELLKQPEDVDASGAESDGLDVPSVDLPGIDSLTNPLGLGEQ